MQQQDSMKANLEKYLAGKYQNQINQIKDYEDAQKDIEKARERILQDIQDKNKLKCLDKNCLKSYDLHSSRRRHTIHKHKALAFKLKYVSFFCDICEDYCSNNDNDFQAHQEACAQEALQEYKYQGIEVKRENLTQEQEALYRKSKKFN